MADILYNSAKSFDEVTKYNYIFCVARSQKQFVINMSCLEEEFTHIMGLDHLKDIRILSSHSSQIKISTFQRMLSKEITFSDISKSDFFFQPFPKTYNSVTKSEYTLTERIIILQNIENILDKAYMGKLYKWDIKSAAIKMPDGKIRHTNISSDYMLTIPSERNPDEKIYLFFYKDRTTEKTKDTKEQLYLFSAFADCLDLSRGQERPYTILQETKENIRTKEKEVLYTHPSYKKELEQHTAQSQPQQNNNIKQIKFNSPAPQNIIHSGSGAAAAVMPKPNPFKNLITNLKNLFKKQDKQTAIPVQTEAQSEIIEKEIKAEEKPVTPKLAKLIEARAAFAENNITLAEYQQAIANYIHSFNGKEMWIKAIDTLRNQLDEYPDNHKKAINYEIDNIERNFERKFAPKHPERKQTLDEIKRAAHENYVKMQNEKAKSEKEEITVNNNHER